MNDLFSYDKNASAPEKTKRYVSLALYFVLFFVSVFIGDIILIVSASCALLWRLITFLQDFK